MVDKRLRGATSGATKDMSLKHPKDGEGLTDKQKVFDIKLPISDYNIISYRQRMSRLYPMINHVSCYRWSFDKDMAKAIVDYIKIVDEHTKQNNIFLQAEKKKNA